MDHVACFSLYVWFSRAGMIPAAGPGPDCVEFPWKALQSVPKTCFHLFVKVQFCLRHCQTRAWNHLARKSQTCVARHQPGSSWFFLGFGVFQEHFWRFHLHQLQGCWCNDKMITSKLQIVIDDFMSRGRQQTVNDGNAARTVPSHRNIT